MSYLKANVVALASLLAGATLVHNIWKPDLVRGWRPRTRRSPPPVQTLHPLQSLPPDVVRPEEPPPALQVVKDRL